MANRYDSPFVFYNDEVGRPLANAQLFFYENNTNTPQNTYQEIGLTNQHTFPVVADGAGIFPDIWLLPQEYSVELRDRNGIFVRRVDNINPQTSETPNQQLICSNIADFKDGILLDGAMINWQIGQVVDTLGYTIAGDGQSGKYQVVAAGTGTANDGTLIQLDNGLQAKLISLQHDKSFVIANTASKTLVYGKDPYIYYTSNQTIYFNILALAEPFTDFGEFKIFNSPNSTANYRVKDESSIPVLEGSWQLWRYMGNDWVMIEFGDTQWSGL